VQVNVIAGSVIMIVWRTLRLMCGAVNFVWGWANNA